MPLIDIHVLEGVFTDEEKGRMISGVAKAFGAVAGKTMEDMTSVRVHEVKSGHWGGAETVWTTDRALEAKAKG
ncbi:MAG: tautomerase family protein [Pseudomonadota bacterium]